MPRTPVISQIERILTDAPSKGASHFPQEFTHYALAQLVYETKQPTPAQLSAVRRAVAKLVNTGRAMRSEDRAWGDFNGDHKRTACRVKVKDRHYVRHTVWAENPSGALYHRALTESEQATRDENRANLAENMAAAVA